MAFVKLKKNWDKKKFPQENKAQMDMAKSNRESGQRLITALKNAELNVNGIQSEEGRQVFANITRTFAGFLESTGTIGLYDISEIDKLLAEMIELYGEALKRGDLDTAKNGVDVIHSGLVEFRKELNAEEKLHKDEILGMRIAKLGEYKTVLSVSQKVYINRRNTEEKEKEYLALNEEYNKLYDTVEKQVQEHPKLYEDLQDLRPGIDKIPAEAEEMHTNIQRLTLMAKQVDDLKQTMEIFRTEYNSQLSALKSLQTMLSIKAGLLTEEDQRRMNEAVEKYQSQLQQAMLEIQRLEELQDQRHRAVSEIRNSMSHGMAVVKHMNEYEELKRRRQYVQDDIVEGQHQIHEQENKNNRITN